MRRRLIQLVLPLLFAVLPVLAGSLILATLPPDARRFYISHLTGLDMVIVGLGCGLFFVQTILAYYALRWQGINFDERPDPWLNRLAQSSEWFPLLGLIGTVAAILQTFSEVQPNTSPATIIRLYAPALTATGSGLLMSFLNILPAWVVIIGRGLILTLSGDEAPTN